MPPRNQAKTYRERFDELTTEMMMSAATKDDIKEIIDIFVKEFQKISALVSEKMAENKAEMSIETARLGKMGAEMEKRLREMDATGKSELRQYIDTRLNELSADLAYTEDELERHTHPDLIVRIDGLKKELDAIEIPEIPKEFDATEIEEQVGKNTKDIEELKKRPIGRIGGGTTDMRIRQAMKNIVLTEAPVGDIDGVNLSYTVSQPIFAVLNFSLNGEFIAQMPNYTIAGRTITFSTALPANFAGKDFEVTFFG